MQLFSADEIVFSKKKLGSHYDPENMKKRPSKVAHNHPQHFFCTCPAAQTEIPYHQKPLNAGLGIHYTNLS